MLATHTFESTQTIIFKTELMTLAAVVCEQLENAGYPTRLGKEKGTITVAVAPEYADGARQLLYVHTPRGEYYLYRG